MKHQYFVERVNGTRQSITEQQCQTLKTCHGYRQVIATPFMTVVRNTKLTRKSHDEKPRLGGGRLRNPYEHLGV